MSKIFINLPTMNDFEYLSTIERIYDLSKNPDNIFIGTTIFWKNEDINSKTKPFFLHIKNNLDKNFKNIKYDIQPWAFYPGVGHGRLSPNKHFNNEKYFLSIDSHTDFINNWDEQIIDLYESSRKFFGKLRVLTSYLTAYCNNNSDYDQNIWKNGGVDTLRYKTDVSNRWAFFDFYKQFNPGGFEHNDSIYPMPNDKILNNDCFDALSSYLIDNEFLPAKKISAHFYFTEADPWLTKYNLNLNKNIKWWGEEFYQSALSYARGYNLVWNKTQILFHKYSDLKYKSNFRAFENFYLEEYKTLNEKTALYNEYIASSINNKDNNNTTFMKTDNSIIYSLFENSNNFGYLPRSIKGFLRYADIDLINRKTSPWWEVPELNVAYK